PHPMNFNTFFMQRPRDDFVYRCLPAYRRRVSKTTAMYGRLRESSVVRKRIPESFLWEDRHMHWMLLLANLFVLPAGAQTPEAPAIRNFLRVNSEFCTGGQPSPEHFQKLKADGV